MKFIIETDKFIAVNIEITHSIKKLIYAFTALLFLNMDTKLFEIRLGL